ncbi:MAG: SOS response-associated peptidase family protein [Pseudomonadota bacterium]
MCNLYSHVKGPKAIRDLANAMGGPWRDSVGNLEPQPAIFPDTLAPVVRSMPEGGRELIMMRWGFPVPEPKPGEKKKPGYQTNIRQPRWKHWLPWMEAGHRCLVAATSFSEYDHRTTPPTCTWFAVDGSRPLFYFAGVWMPWALGPRGTKANPAPPPHLLFSFLTTAPNAVVKPVHPVAMPVLLLTEATRETWMTGSVEEALALQRPAPDVAVRIVATGARQDG